MAKKIRFPLKLAEGAEVRTLEELREHFDLQAVLEYYKNGKLLTWLEDRYLEGEVEAIQALDEAALDFQRRLCEVFQVEYAGAGVDMEEIERRQERLKRLRTVTDDAECIRNIDSVAFDQEELADLLDEEQSSIYLCGRKFTVPASRKGITYIGIGNPAVHISGKLPENPEELKIEFQNCAVDNLPLVATVEAEDFKLTACKRGVLPAQAIFSGDCFTDHYWLYYEEKEDAEDLTRYCYEFSTGKTKELPENVADELSECDVKIARGDEVLCMDSCTDGSLFILNLHSSPVPTMDKYYDGDGSCDFTSAYLVYRSDMWSVTIVDRQTKESFVLCIEEDSSGSKGLTYDGTLIKKNIDNIHGTFAFIGKKLYFEVAQGRDHWLASFDPNADEFRLITQIKNYWPDNIIGNSNYIYLIKHDGFQRNTISVIHLETGVEHVLLNVPKYFWFSTSDDYLVVWWEERKYKTPTEFEVFDRKRTRSISSNEPVVAGPNENYNLFAIELATGKIKDIQFELLGSFSNWAVQVFQSTFYCRQPEERNKTVGTGEGTGYKFDLTEDSPQPVEFNF